MQQKLHILGLQYTITSHCEPQEVNSPIPSPRPVSQIRCISATVYVDRHFLQKKFFSATKCKNANAKGPPLNTPLTMHACQPPKRYDTDLLSCTYELTTGHIGNRCNTYELGQLASPIIIGPCILWPIYYYLACRTKIDGKFL